MPTFFLEEDPELFLCIEQYGDKFRYCMASFDAKGNRTTKYDLNLKSEKLMIHGTEIEESMLQKLHESLTLKQNSGIAYVNSNGSCYFYADVKGNFGPIYNVIFDWSVFGITVPNSTNDTLRKRVSSVEGELSSCKADFEASKKEVEELKAQLLACQKEKQDTEEEVYKVRGQLSSIEFQLEIYKLELVLCKKEVKELQDVRDQLSLTNSVLEASKKRVTELEEELSTCRKESNKVEMEQRKIKDEFSLVASELQSTKAKLESSNASVKELECQVSSCKKEIEDKKSEVSHKNDELSNAQEALQSSKMQLQMSKSMVHEQQAREAELRKYIDYLSSIDSHIKFTNKKLDQLLNSMLWTRVDQPRLQRPLIAGDHLQDANLGDSLLPGRAFDIHSTVPIISEVNTLPADMSSRDCQTS